MFDLKKIELNVLRQFALSRLALKDNNKLINNDKFGFLRFLDNLFFHRILAILLHDGMLIVDFIQNLDIIAITNKGIDIVITKQFNQVIK